MSRFNVYRDGKIHVCARLCETCVYRPSSPVFNSPVIKKAARKGTAVVCHSTLGTGRNAVCRGFYEREPTLPLLLARSTGNIRFVELEEKGK